MKQAHAAKLSPLMGGMAVEETVTAKLLDLKLRDAEDGMELVANIDGVPYHIWSEAGNEDEDYYTFHVMSTDGLDMCMREGYINGKLSLTSLTVVGDIKIQERYFGYVADLKQKLVYIKRSA